jgi:hypothetical protein
MRGTAADAVIGVGETESAAIVDGILTLGILWLDHCWKQGDGRRHFGGLKVIVPAWAWRTTAERMAWLNHAAADFQLFTLDERGEELVQLDSRDTGNLESRLVHAFSNEAAIERCEAGVERLLALVSQAARERVEVRASSATEVGLLLHGLEFARVRHGFAANSFTREDEVTFGAGANETPLTEANEGLCRDLFARLFASREPAECTLIRSSACNRNTGWRRGCARGSPSCYRDCAGTCSTRRCRRSRWGIEACWTLSRSTATEGWRLLN